MFATYKCFGENNYNKLIRFEDLAIGDIFVVDYNFAQPIVKTLRSMDIHFDVSNAINLGAIMWLSLGLYLFFSDAEIVFLDFIKYEQADKIIILILMSLVSLFFVYLGFVYLKKAKKYYKNKAKMENEITDETVRDELWQRTCQKCGKSHDIDYPKCPYCKFDYVAKQR